MNIQMWNYLKNRLNTMCEKPSRDFSMHNHYQNASALICLEIMKEIETEFENKSLEEAGYS